MVISSKYGTYNLSHKLPRDLRLRKWENFEKISKVHAVIAFSLVHYLTWVQEVLPYVASMVAGYKFRFKLAVLIVWINFVQKEYFQSKTAEMNFAIKFDILILV